MEGVTANPKIFKDAGLPNITGSFGHYSRWSGAAKATGAFQSYIFSAYYNLQSTEAGQGETFDASRCSSVYRNDITTVQPASYTVYYIIKVKK